MSQTPDVALLRDLLAVLRDAGAPCFLIGAGARVLALDEPCEIPGARATLDWDFAVQVGSWEEWRSLRERLLSRAGGSFRSTTAHHRLQHVEGGLLDLIPFGGLESPSGEIAWPDRSTMSVVGFGEAAAHCNSIEIEKGLYVQVACIPSLALLKLHAYLDRRARGFSKDIQDFDWFLRHYDLVPGHELRIHEELREPLIASEIESSTAGAMLLGTDVARVHSRSALEPLAGLLTEFGDPFGRPVEDVLRTYSTPDEAQERVERARIRARLDAFVRGLSFGSRTREG